MSRLVRAIFVISALFAGERGFAAEIPWMWLPASKDEFFNDLIPEMNLPLRWEYLRNDHPVAVAMNEVASRIDRHLRNQAGGAMDSIPVPTVMVRDHDDVQAYAVAARLCLDIPVRLDASASAQVEFAELTRDGGIEAMRRQYANCRHLRSDTEVGNFIAWFNAEHEDCRLGVEGNGATREIVPGAGCALDAAIKGKIARAKVLTVKVNAPWVIVHSGIARVARTPDQQAFVIAHELAHYYQAHYARSLARYVAAGASHEEEADALATKWVAAIGFDPFAGSAFFENYMTLFPESAGASPDTAHPDPCARAENISRIAAELR